jgi:DNA-directed RNA polymerase specialized sigma24 family protein
LLRALALRRSNQPQLAREAFARAEAQLRQVEPVHNREAWLSQILHREAVKVLTQND